MPRPFKPRRICAMPGCCNFGPLSFGAPNEQICMSLDEYETIRLIDFEGLNQEQCAERMDVARTTAQSIYASARAKLAECLVCGAELRIQGGQYELCDGDLKGCGCGFCFRNHDRSDIFLQQTEDNKMKIAVTYENDMVGQHFGQTKCFKIFEIENEEIVSATLAVPTEGHGALAGFLKSNGVNVVICGGIGDGMCTALDNAGIMVYAGVTGPVDDVVRAKIANTLTRVQGSTCGCHGEHDHEHEHHHEHEGGCGCGGNHEHHHEHEHSGGCGCGGNHEHHHEHEHSGGCGCGGNH